MLPHIQPEHRHLAVHEWAVLIRSAEDLEFAACQGEPRPAAPEAGCGRAGELLLELRDIPERLLDRIGERASRLAAAALACRRHDRPEERVIVMSAAVVADRGADIVGDRVDAAEQLFEGLLVKLGVAVER